MYSIVADTQTQTSESSITYHLNQQRERDAARATRRVLIEIGFAIATPHSHPMPDGLHYRLIANTPLRAHRSKSIHTRANNQSFLSKLLLFSLRQSEIFETFANNI